MFLNKAKKKIRLIFSKKRNPNQIFEDKLLKNSLVKSFKKFDSLYELDINNESKLIMRDHNFSDYLVFNQIFIKKEYDLILKTFLLNDYFSKKKVIIDAGANVGYTSFWFLNYFSNARIFAIEPSEKNFKILNKNLENFNNANVKTYQCALSEKQGNKYSIHSDFRDGKDWSFNTVENKSGDITGISIKEIIDNNNLDYISLLKIDIEGAERFIFKSENDLSYLEITEIIAIEIHDEFNIRNSICKILKENNFFIFDSGELTIGFNHKLLFNHH